RRLIKFLEGGNRYSGAVATCEGGAIKVIVRETYQDPKFFGRPSFTIKKGREEFRPYAKESLLTRTADVEEADEDGEEPAEELDGMHTVDSAEDDVEVDRKSTRLNSSHLGISYAVFCLKKKKRR